MNGSSDRQFPKRNSDDYHRDQEAKRKRQYDQEQARRTKEIADAKAEIANLCVILQAIPDDQEAARTLISNQIEQCQKKLPRFEGRIWWHWLIEHCPKCDCGVSQQPLPESLGEDCELFDKIDQYALDQEDGTTEYKCSCGTPLQMRYRHATADLSEEAKQEALKYADDQSNKVA